LSLPRQISNRQLTPEKLPGPDAPWTALERFALTFDGYEHWGSDRCAEIANSRRHSTLTELRTCLFFEQRRWRNQGEEPNTEAMRYVRDVMEQIRARVTQASKLLE